MNRYYFSRRKGEYWILDRTLDTRIAKTDWREAAHLICETLNVQEGIKSKDFFMVSREYLTDAGAPIPGCLI